MAGEKKKKAFPDINKFHEKLYLDLESMIQKLDENLEFKMYAFVLNEKGSVESATRVKTVLTGEKGAKTQIKPEKLENHSEVLKKLRLPDECWSGDLEGLNRNIQQYQLSRTEPLQQKESLETEESMIYGLPDEGSVVAERKRSIVYAQSLKFSLFEGQKETCLYVIALDYVDPVTQEVFYGKSEFSFLKMFLDYYFKDYYVETTLESLKHLEPKYKESPRDFLQRLAKMFLGKMQAILENEKTLAWTASGNNPIGNQIAMLEGLQDQYIFSTLMDNLEGISTRTYEGESPFGCLLLIPSELLEGQHELIDYAIEFDRSDQSIPLEDSRRIRKLLELTSNKSDLFLISDGRKIHGIGEVDWAVLKETQNIVFRIDFKGLSRYEIALLNIESTENTDKKWEVKDGRKTFTMTTSLNIISNKLMGVAFRNPEISQQSFEPELLYRTLKAQFRNDHAEGEVAKDIQFARLAQVILEASKQKSGTMVVITDPDTAVDEVKRLRKQSTPVIKKLIDPQFISQLTAIDGAIYYDTRAYCHAIGVILDGVVTEGVGDASRGARFNSAYRYLEKFKKEDKQCVIAIISEDGMVDLIPEPESEKVNRKRIAAYLEYIEETSEIDDKIVVYYDRFLLGESGDSEIEVDSTHLFLIGDAWYNKENHFQSVKYYTKGLENKLEFEVEVRRKLGISYYNQSLSLEQERKKQLLDQALNQFELILDYCEANNKSMSSHNYNMMGVIFSSLAKNEGNKGFYLEAEKYYIKAIEKKDNAMFRLNLMRTEFIENKWKEALNSYLKAELLDFDYVNSHKNRELFIQRIKAEAQKDHEYLNFALKMYANIEDQKIREKSVLFQRLQDIASENLISSNQQAFDLPDDKSQDVN
ncbi:diadenylate cyclase [Saccharibacillus sp. O23]|uniref:diadenylate cyclase n=1 Tax=Saccharibacillus sp. O23 TaxID=2009338 RepID=UPI0015C68D2D|nr:diadenylate cyclase [Saccharibacillus sp. O23]